MLRVDHVSSYYVADEVVPLGVLRNVADGILSIHYVGALAILT